MELYIHIPFCVRKCNYCAFDSYTCCDAEKMEQYTASLLREASQRASYVTEPIETVYFGGGTPSLLSPELLENLVLSLKNIFSFSSVREFSVEANPGTVSEKWLETALRCGINRISFGVQAFQNHLLQTLGRIHTFDEVIRSVDTAHRCGFHNINLDLIFGIPGQTMSDWHQTLERVIALAPVHISAYGLIPEEGTPLHDKLQAGTLSLPDPDLERDMYDHAISILNNAGLFQYEISNFARPGYRCLHNIGYWNQVPYLGLGLSAASMVRSPVRQSDTFSSRWTNPSSFDEYDSVIDDPSRFSALKEDISDADARFETVMLSLRMTEGMRRSRFAELHGDVPERWYGPILAGLNQQGLLELKDDCWRLTRRGMDIQNSILLEFME